MYLTDIRGFSADSVTLFPARLGSFTEREKAACLFSCGGDTIFRGQKCHDPPPFGSVYCRITIHGMGMRGDKGLTPHFARFCRLYDISPLFLSLSDMGIAFFVPEEEKERVLDALCAYFPIWA